jgi:hypothetical protein
LVLSRRGRRTMYVLPPATISSGTHYVMERNVQHYDIRDPLHWALQFVSILPRLARHGMGLCRPLEGQLAISDVNQFQFKPWSKLHQRKTKNWQPPSGQNRSKRSHKRRCREEIEIDIGICTAQVEHMIALYVFHPFTPMFLFALMMSLASCK